VRILGILHGARDFAKRRDEIRGGGMTIGWTCRRFAPHVDSNVLPLDNCVRSYERAAPPS
jgi:hypothetical protein